MANQIKIAVMSVMLAATIVGASVLMSGKAQKPTPSLAAEEMFVQSKTAKPNPDTSTTSVLSPDGKMTLTMKVNRVNESSTWTFLADGKEILSENLPNGSIYKIPFNTFSPDNKYIFLQKTVSDAMSYPVLSTSGKDISGDGMGLEIVSLFSAKFPEYKVTEVTGWGGMNLIVFNTEKTSGGEGSSFWFEVPSKAFIRLSSKFN